MPVAITTPATSVELDRTRTGEVPFTVFNKSDQAVVARVLIYVSDDDTAADESWFSIQGEQERAVPPEGAEHYVVRIVVPEAVTAGSYTFRFDAADVEDVNERHVAGPTVRVQVPEVKQKTMTCPWCIPAAIVALVVIAVAVVAYLLLWEDDVVEIPPVQDLTEEAAVAELEEAGFIVTVVEQESDTVPPDVAIETDPPAGDAVEQDSEISLLVSTGPTEVEIPEVVDMGQQQAIDALHNACEPAPCFDVDVDREVEEGGIVVEVDPPATVAVEPGTRVAITTEIEIPDLTGDAHDAARDTLRSMCLPEPCFSVNWAGYGQRGVVGETDPDAGEIVAPGTEVTLTTGVEIPTVNSVSVEVAKGLLELACEPAPCFDVVESSELTFIQPYYGRVIRSDPPAGEIVEPGSEVVIVVGTPIVVDDFPEFEFPIEEFELPTPTPD